LFPGERTSGEAKAALKGATVVLVGVHGSLKLEVVVIIMPFKIAPNNSSF
jgi:hypothetical protein